MRIVRFEDAAGETRMGVERADGSVVSAEPDEPWTDLAEAPAQRVSRILAPVAPVNIFAIGLNYKRHAAETGAKLPEHPVVFMKPTTAAADPGTPIRIPACSAHGPEVDYEGELAVIIGKEARNVSVEDSMDHVFGFTCANDVSARRWQKRLGGGQFVRGKGFDTFCPLGPRLVTPDEIGESQDLRIRTYLNGEVMQDSSTADMIFPVAELVAFLSQDTTLLPGTVILTGTPEGVGFAQDPQVFLSPGDEVTVEIDKIGRLTNPVIGPEG